MKILGSRYVHPYVWNGINDSHYVALERHISGISPVEFALTSCSLFQDLEVECLKPEPSQKLLEIGLCLLKWISSHRGLTYVYCSPFGILELTFTALAGLTILTSTPAGNTTQRRQRSLIHSDTMKSQINSSISMSFPRSESSTSSRFGHSGMPTAFAIRCQRRRRPNRQNG